MTRSSSSRFFPLSEQKEISVITILLERVVALAEAKDNNVKQLTKALSHLFTFIQRPEALQCLQRLCYGKILSEAARNKLLIIIRRSAKSPKVQQFLEQAAQKPPSPEEAPKLFAALRYSMKAPLFNQASAAAMTVLSCYRVSLKGEDLSDTQLQGSYVSGDLEEVKLSRANLHKVIISHANLNKAMLYRANLAQTMWDKTGLAGTDLRDVDWGQSRLELKETPSLIIHHPTRPWFAIAQGRNIMLVDSKTGQEWGNTLIGDLEGVALTTTLLTVALSYDERLIALTSYHGVQLWETKTGVLKAAIQEPGVVKSMAISPDGNKVMIGFHYGTVLWTIAGESNVDVLQRHTSEVTSVAISPDGAALASGNRDGIVRLLRTPAEIILRGHTEPITKIIFSHDSKLVISGSEDGTVRLWDAMTGQLQSTLQGPVTSRILFLAMSPDGKVLVSADASKTVRFHNIVTGCCQTQQWEDYIEDISIRASASGEPVLTILNWGGKISFWNITDEYGHFDVRCLGYRGDFSMTRDVDLTEAHTSVAQSSFRLGC